jgi:hypothetical protein
MERKHGVNVFFSYAHEDERFRAELEKHLAGLKQSDMIKIWHDRQIAPGAKFDSAIAAQLESADLILLLVSPDFLAETSSMEEMKRALERHVAGQALVIPIILRPVDWHNTPAGKLVPLPADGKPLTTWARRDEAFLDVARGIRDRVRELLGPSDTADYISDLQELAGFSIAFDSQLSPQQVKGTLTALADYYRAVGGVGLQVDFELEDVLIIEPEYV